MHAALPGDVLHDGALKVTQIVEYGTPARALFADLPWVDDPAPLRPPPN